MIMIMHRLKRLIGSFYHQKRIDIIITDNAYYVRNGGVWKLKHKTITFGSVEKNTIVGTVPDIMGIIVQV